MAELFGITNFKGILTEISPEDLKPEFAQSDVNIFTDSPAGALRRRKGSDKDSSILSPAVSVPSLHIFREEGQDAGILAEVNGYLAYRPKGGSWADKTPLGYTTSQKNNRRYSDLLMGNLYIADKGNRLSWFNGQESEQIKCSDWAECRDFHPSCIARWRDQIFIVEWDTIYFNSLTVGGAVVPATTRKAWNTGNYIKLPNGLRIFAVKEFRDMLVVLQRTHLWVIRGRYPYSVEEIKLTSGMGVGCLSPDSVVIKGGTLFGADENCIWSFDGANIQKMTSNTIKTKYKDRTIFPICQTGEIWDARKPDFEQCTLLNVDVELAPDVVRLIRYDATERETGHTWTDLSGGTSKDDVFDGPQYMTDHNRDTFAMYDYNDVNDYENVYVKWFLDEEEKRTFKLDHIKVNYGFCYEDVSGEATAKVRYRDGTGWHDADTPMVFDACDGNGLVVTEHNDKIWFKADHSTADVYEVGIFIVCDSGKYGHHFMIIEVWTEDGEILSPIYICRDVKDWGILEARYNLRTVNRLVNTLHPEQGNKKGVIDIYLHSSDDNGATWSAWTKYETIPPAVLEVGDELGAEMKDGIVAHDYDVKVQWKVIFKDDKPVSPAFYGIRFEWLKTDSDWLNYPVANVWNNKILWSFPKLGGVTNTWIIFDKQGDWHLWEYPFAAASLVNFDGSLYGGNAEKSDLLQFNTGLTDNDGSGEVAITGKWESKDFYLKDPRCQMELKSLYMTIKNNEASDKTLALKCYLDDVLIEKSITAIASEENTYDFFFEAGNHIGHKYKVRIEGEFDFQVMQCVTEVNPLSLMTR